MTQDPEPTDEVPEKGTFHDQLLRQLAARGMIDPEILNADPETRKRLVTIGAKPKAPATFRDTRHDHLSGPPVNCAERVHLCQAVCCSMGILLSEEEVAAGKVEWDEQKPHFIRQKEDGYCCHLQREDRACGIYEDRPQPCRKYSCAGDPRIWTNFEKMELNVEWIAAFKEGKVGPNDASPNHFS